MKVYEPYLPYLAMAMASPYGVIIRTSNIKLSQAHLYAARRNAGDPDMERLQMRPDPLGDPQLLWIIKGEEKEKKNG